jgi:DNA-directed RNA polymerase specialized sigma24 family protein
MRGHPKNGVKSPKGVLTTRQIAEILGISHGTVQNIERRALEKLRKALAGWAP